jgi:hypothetical protein
MEETRGEPTEHSLLLPRPSTTTESASNLPPKHPVDPSGGIIPTGIDSYENDYEANGVSDVENAEAETAEAAPYGGIPEAEKRMKYIFPAVAIGVFLAAADGTIIISSYGKIGSELDALNMTSWIANAYFLTLTAFQPLYGKLSDIFGRKACLQFAYFVFGLGCLFCGISRNINQLILSRAFAGIGGGGMTTLVSILLSDIVPLRERGTWQGYINIVYASGAASGAPLGGEVLICYRCRFPSDLRVRHYRRFH